MQRLSDRSQDRLATASTNPPVAEWKRVSGILGTDLLARLVGISQSSLRRYQSAVRTTPDRIAARLHFLAIVAGHLSGAYNEMGVRQWFDRKRAQLDDHAPSEFLKGDWSPDTAGPAQVRELTR
jgi:hypothetical protein